MTARPQVILSLLVLPAVLFAQMPNSTTGIDTSRNVLPYGNVHPQRLNPHPHRQSHGSPSRMSYQGSQATKKSMSLLTPDNLKRMICDYGRIPNQIQAGSAAATDSSWGWSGLKNLYASGNVTVPPLRRRPMPKRRPTSTFQATISDSLTERWREYIANKGLPSDDISQSIAVDYQGNVYVGGLSDGDLTGEDFVIIKYNSNGVVQWTARYNGPANGYDQLNQIAVDNHGNVYGTGYTQNTAHTVDLVPNYDYLTVKYNTDGVLQWATTYDGPTSDDQAYAIAVDSNGNAFVTGASVGLGDSPDYTTVKYNASGGQEWVARYDGPAGGIDVATAIAVDNHGSVSVSGYSFDTGINYVFATIKYDSSGNQQWIDRYGQTAGYGYAFVHLTIDESGNTYVAGTGVGAVAIKYDSVGVRAWVENYDGRSYAIRVGDAGKVYVGSSSETVVYDRNGSQLWVARYADLVGVSDPGAIDLVIDRAGNVYVGGDCYSAATLTDYLVIKYDPNGVFRGKKTYNAPGNPDDQVVGMALDNSANVYVTGIIYSTKTYTDFETVSYDSTGKFRWVKVYNGPGVSSDKATAMVTDSSGNIYVTGLTQTADSEYICTVKYDANGVFQWKRFLDPGGNLDDDLVPTAIAADRDGNCYVAGTVGRPELSYIVKYNTLGVQQWATTGYANAVSSAIALDDSENSYVVGYFVNLRTSNLDIFTCKVSPSGSLRWLVSYDGPSDMNDYAFTLNIDKEQNVYVGGLSGTGANSADFVTLKYGSDGTLLWSGNYNPTGESYGAVYALSLDDSANVYVTGPSLADNNYFDVATIKYSTDGTEQWVTRYDGPDHLDDWTNAIMVDKQHNVYISGLTESYSTYYDFLTLKYNAAGTQQWMAQYDGGYNAWDDARHMAFDRYHNIYIIGESIGGDNSYDIAMVKYDPNGNQKWVERYSNPDLARIDDIPVGIAVDTANHVDMAGYDANTGYYPIAEPYSAHYVTIQYQQYVQPPAPPTPTSPSNSSVLSSYRVRLQWHSNDRSPSYEVQAATNISFVPLTTDVSAVSDTILDIGQLSNGTTYYWRVRGVNEGGAGDWSEVWKFTYSYPLQWQIISVPFRVTDPRKETLFPGAISDAFAYSGSAYSICDTLTVGTGYWLELGGIQGNPITGDSVLIDSIAVVTGWNLIGSISKPIPVANISGEPVGLTASNFFQYQGGYAHADTIQPGRGYWVKVNQDGVLTLDGEIPTIAGKRIRIVATNELPPPPPDLQSRTVKVLPKEYLLAQSYPNPFNPTATIEYSLPSDSRVSLKIYNLLGQLVQTLSNDIEPAGYKQVVWNASNAASGIYFYRLEATSIANTSKTLTQVKKMILLK